MRKLLATTSLAAALLGAMLVTGATPTAAAFGCSTPEVVTDVAPDGIDATTPFVMSLDGSRVLMSSNEDPLGDNPDGGDELFLYDHVLDRLEQLTDLDDDADIPSHGYGMDQNASRIAFASNGDPLGTNADGSYELFFIGSSSGDPFGTLQLLQLTTTTGGTHVPSVSVSAAGTRVAFTSDRNLDASNADLGAELYVASVDGALATTIEQLGSNGSTNPTMSEVEMSDLATSVAFLTNVASRGALSNADGSLEVARTAIVAGEPTVAITALPAGSVALSHSIDATGNKVAFATEAEVSPTGPNTDGQSEVYVRNVTAGTTQRVTNASSSSSNPDLSADASAVVYVNSVINILRTNLTTFSGFVVSANVGSRPSTDIGGENVAFEIDVAGSSGEKEELAMAICKEPSFIDVGVNHPFFAEIEWMADKGISTGSDPGPTYDPGNPVSRQAMSAFMFRLADVGSFPPPLAPSFTDVGFGHPFFEEIEWMAATGISEGFLPGPTYRPAAPVSRAAMSAFMFRLANPPAFEEPTSSTFTDVSTGHPFFLEIEWMASERITAGFQPGPTYRPSTAVSRQAMSAFMQRLGERVPFIPPVPDIPGG